MSVTICIVQQYDIRAEKEFMVLEARFSALGATRPGYPKGRRRHVAERALSQR